MIAGVFEVPAWLLAWFYSFTSNYALAIALIAVLVMMLVTPLNLKSTKGMLEMQRLAPEMRKLQNEHRGDRQKLNEEMMKLYQEHKVNPMASCLPLVAQMPVFIIMFRILHGLTYEPVGDDELDRQGGATPAAPTTPERSASCRATLARSPTCTSRWFGKTEMKSFGLDLSQVAGRGARRRLRHGPDLRPARRRARRAVLRPAADGRRPRRGQPDDVARPAEADAVPAGRLRRLPDLLPARPRHLLHRPVGVADRPAGLHHQALLRSRRVARPPGPAGRRPAREIAKADGGGGGMLAQARRDLAESEGAARQAAASRPTRRQSDRQAAAATPKKRSRRRLRRPSASARRTTAPKSRPTPTESTPLRPAAGWQSSARRRKKR